MLVVLVTPDVVEDVFVTMRTSGKSPPSLVQVTEVSERDSNTQLKSKLLLALLVIESGDCSGISRLTPEITYIMNNLRNLPLNVLTIDVNV